MICLTIVSRLSTVDRDVMLFQQHRHALMFFMTVLLIIGVVGFSYFLYFGGHGPAHKYLRAFDYVSLSVTMVCAMLFCYCLTQYSVDRTHIRLPDAAMLRYPAQQDRYTQAHLRYAEFDVRKMVYYKQQYLARWVHKPVLQDPMLSGYYHFKAQKHTNLRLARKYPIKPPKYDHKIKW